MNETKVMEVIIGHTREVLPGLANYQFHADDSLRELGANSIDRSEIVMMTLESLSLAIPLIEVARASSVGELASILYSKLPRAARMTA